MKERSVTMNEAERVALREYVRGELDGLHAVAQSPLTGPYWRGFYCGMRERWCSYGRVDGANVRRELARDLSRALRRLNTMRPGYLHE